MYGSHACTSSTITVLPASPNIRSTLYRLVSTAISAWSIVPTAHGAHMPRRRPSSQSVGANRSCPSSSPVSTWPSAASSPVYQVFSHAMLCSSVSGAPAAARSRAYPRTRPNIWSAVAIVGRAA